MNDTLRNQILDRLNTRDTDLHGRRITGAANSVDPSDYTTKKEVMGFIDNLQTSLDLLQKRVVDSLPGLQMNSLPVEIVSIHPNSTASSSSQLIIADVNSNRTSISFTADYTNQQSIGLGLNYIKNGWIATTASLSLIRNTTTGLRFYVAASATPGAAVTPSTLCMEMVNDGKVRLGAGASVNNIVTTISDPGSDNNLATEKAIRSLVAGYTGSFVVKTYSLSGNLTIGYSLNVASSVTVTVAKGLITGVA